MNQICTKCNTSNPQNARFCKECGTTIGATFVQGRTVVSPTPLTPSNMPEEQLKTVVQRAEKTFGTGEATICQNSEPLSSSNQRELTYFVNDKSGSMTEKYDGNLKKIEAASRACITMTLEKAQIDPQDEIGVITFDLSASCVLSLSSIHSHKAQILNAFQSMIASGGTDINKGLKTARDSFDWHRNNVVRRIILLTDGHGGRPLKTAEELKSRGVIIDVIGIGPTPGRVDEKLLRKVASVIEGEVRYRFIEDSLTLTRTYTQLANKTATY